MKLECCKGWYIISFHCQVKDRQRKKQPTKGIRLDAEGDASLEDLTNIAAEGAGNEPNPDADKSKSSRKKVSSHVSSIYFKRLRFTLRNYLKERHEAWLKEHNCVIWGKIVEICYYLCKT